MVDYNYSFAEILFYLTKGIQAQHIQAAIQQVLTGFLYHHAKDIGFSPVSSFSFGSPHSSFSLSPALALLCPGDPRSLWIYRFIYSGLCVGWAGAHKLVRRAESCAWA